MECSIFGMALSDKLTKKLLENFGAARHGDGNGLYLEADPSGARRWIVRVVVKGQKNKKGALLRTDFGLGGANIDTLQQARERALEYRLMAGAGLTPVSMPNEKSRRSKSLQNRYILIGCPCGRTRNTVSNGSSRCATMSFPRLAACRLTASNSPK